MYCLSLSDILLFVVPDLHIPGRLRSRTLKSKEPLVRVYNILDTVIDISYI